MLTLPLACSTPSSFSSIPKSVTRQNFPSSAPSPPQYPSSTCGVRFLRNPASISVVTLAKKSDDEEPITATRDELDGRRPLLGLDFKWADLLNPDADNVLAVGLTGLLTWASVQVLWQLLFISLAILVAAVKYSFIAALLLFILITLL